MKISKYKKVFGIGPTGALITIVLFCFAWWADRGLGHPAISSHAAILKWVAALLIAAGAALHVWTFMALRSWWSDSRLCTGGPFQWFRHPMYAAWVTFIALGVCLLLNSWVLVGWYVLLHPIWHRLVTREETVMVENFGDEYMQYKARTGRFFPKFRSMDVYRNV